MIRAETQTDLIRVDDGQQGIQGPQGIQGIQGVQGPQGDDGKGVSSVITYYLLSTVNTGTPSETNWSTIPQDYPATGTKYYWTKTITTYTDSSTSETSPVYNSALTNAVKDARDANETAQIAVESITDVDEYARGTITYQYDNSGTIETVFKKEDGTYYYIDSNEDEITVSYSQLEVDSDTGEPITDRLTDGLNATIDELSSTTSELQITATEAQAATESLSEAVDTVSSSLTQMDTKIDNVEVSASEALNFINAHFEFSDNGFIVRANENTSTHMLMSPVGLFMYLPNNDSPVAKYTDYIQLGADDKAHIILSPIEAQGLEFYDKDGNKVAWITANTLNIQEAEIQDTLRIGKFKWQVNEDNPNRISLIYAP